MPNNQDYNIHRTSCSFDGALDVCEFSACSSTHYIESLDTEILGILNRPIALFK